MCPYKCLRCQHQVAALCYIYSTSRHWQQSGSSWIFHPDCCLRERDYIHFKLSHFPSPKPESRLYSIYRSRELAVSARPVAHRHTHTLFGPGFILHTEHTLCLSTHNFDRHASTTLDCRLAWIKFCCQQLLLPLTNQLPFPKQCWGLGETGLACWWDTIRLSLCYYHCCKKTKQWATHGLKLHRAAGISVILYIYNNNACMLMFSRCNVVWWYLGGWE